MTDFNKGDFTQQGVDGHVNAKLRLNAKRYVDIDLTSNEQASGCTISGHVYDSLNNITYPIGSAKTITSKTITENGTYNASADNCDGYNPVTVNVPAPAPEKHYILHNDEYTSIIQQGVGGITIPGVYFYAPEVTLIIDGVTKTLKGYVDSASTNVAYVSGENSGMEIIVTENYLGLGVFSGTLIPTADTEPTTHTITIYYEGDKKYWQIVKVASDSSSSFYAILNYYFINNNVTYSGVMTTKLASIGGGEHLNSAIEVYPDGSYVNCVTGANTLTIVSSAYENNLTYNRYSVQNNSNVSSECNLAFLTYKTEVR